VSARTGSDPLNADAGDLAGADDLANAGMRRWAAERRRPSPLVIEFGTHLLVPLQRRHLRCQLFSDHCR